MPAKYEKMLRGVFFSAVADSIRVFWGQGLRCGCVRVNGIGFFVGFGFGGSGVIF